MQLSEASNYSGGLEIVLNNLLLTLDSHTNFLDQQNSVWDLGFIQNLSTTLIPWHKDLKSISHQEEMLVIFLQAVLFTEHLCMSVKFKIIKKINDPELN